MQLEDYKFTKYLVGRLDKTLIEENINDGISVLIPINMKLFKMNGLLNSYFDLNRQLYFCVELLKDDLKDDLVLSILEYENGKAFKSVEFTPDKNQKETLYAYAIEGLIYLNKKSIRYKPYHNME